MAIGRTMSNTSSRDDHEKDEHEHDLVMPGFRFHPTEEELIEFYLRRKVEGKRFNIELITFLDLYRYDPWELPALAAIGEKEWFFYVPRDRKYRNGDRPNRVTTSGYWKATGADRMIRNESSRSIGLKKTLVFYSGKAPKGIRTSWIMNEYRLPHHDTDRYNKAEISLCRVYKRPGVEDHLPLPNSVPIKPSTSKGLELGKNSNMGHQALNNSMETEKLHQNGSTSSTSTGPTTTSMGMASDQHLTSMEEGESVLQHQPNSVVSLLTSCSPFPCTSSSATNITQVDDVRKLVDNYPQMYYNVHQHHHQHYSPLMPAASSSVAQLHSLPLNSLTTSLQTFSDKLWEWNLISESARDFNSL